MERATHGDRNVESRDDRLVHRHFERSAAATPEAPAFVVDREIVTYRQMNERASRLAVDLRGLGVVPGALVGIFMERSTDLVAAILGTLKAGGACVPLDPEAPPERLRFILDDTHLRVILTQEGLAARLGGSVPHVVCVDAIARSAAGAPPLRSTIGPEDLAFVFYTSGSTGAPKGVMLPHRVCWRAPLWLQETFPLARGDRQLLKTSIGVAGLLRELFWPSVSGGCSIIVRPGDEKDIRNLVRLLSEHEVATVLFLPAMLEKAQETPGFEDCHRLRYIFCGSDVLPSSVCARHFSSGPRAELHNIYGLTEVLYGSAWRCEPDLERETVFIGRPVVRETYLLDEERRPVPTGAPGELYIGGPFVASGYWGRAELTAARFLPDPFSPAPGATMFRTGDRARFDASGNLELLGRADLQVKVRGFRVEPEEVEAILRQHPAVRQAVVVPRKSVSGGHRLVAHLVRHSGAPSDSGDLRRFLKDRLPEYMIPSVFVDRAELPALPSGKLDRRRLEVAPLEPAVPGPIGPMPRTPMERLVADVWQDVLEVERVGLHDDFFALGGDSLAALSVLSSLEHRFGLRLESYDFLFRSVEQLAASVDVQVRYRESGRLPGGGRVATSDRRGGREEEEEPIIVPLRAQGAKRPLFLVSPPHRTSMSYLALVARLDPDRPVYGLQFSHPRKLVRSAEWNDARAARFLRLMKEVQPVGPYLVGGHCEGARLALRIARRVEARGESIQMLIAMDTTPHRMLDPLYRMGEYLLQLPGAAKACAQELEQHVRRQPASLSWWARARRSLRSVERSLPRIELVKVACPVLLLRVEHQEHLRRLQDDLGWRRYTRSDVTCCIVPGDHRTFFQRPHVETFARELSTFLRGID